MTSCNFTKLKRLRKNNRVEIVLNHLKVISGAHPLFKFPVILVRLTSITKWKLNLLWLLLLLCGSASSLPLSPTSYNRIQTRFDLLYLSTGLNC